MWGLMTMILPVFCKFVGVKTYIAGETGRVVGVPCNEASLRREESMISPLPVPPALADPAHPAGAEGAAALRLTRGSARAQSDARTRRCRADSGLSGHSVGRGRGVLVAVEVGAPHSVTAWAAERAAPSPDCSCPRQRSAFSWS